MPPTLVGVRPGAEQDTQTGGIGVRRGTQGGVGADAIFSTWLVVTRVFTLQLLVISHLLYLSSAYLHFMCFGVYGTWGRGQSKEKRNQGKELPGTQLRRGGGGRRPPTLGPLVAEPVGTRGRRSCGHGEPAGWDVEGKVRQRAGGQLLVSASQMAYRTWSLRERK